MTIDEILKQAQVPDSLYEKAINRYKSIGKWLERPDSSVAKFNPKIYAQGSFALGTAINSPARQGEYDIDLVCELNLSNYDISQQKLKEMVGKEIELYAQANGINAKPEEGNRCWTLNYSDDENFHIDILPAIPYGREESSPYAKTSIGITDKKHRCYTGRCNDYPPSNPKGYAKWFRRRIGNQFEYQVRVLQERVDDVPYYKVKTHLQQAIQVLKYHRDKMFANDFENRPISIIITTLAAHAYNGETNLRSALANIANKMGQFIEKQNDIHRISNPTNPEENFADKWQEHPEKKEAFFKWLHCVNEEFNPGKNSNFFNGQLHRQKLSYPENISACAKITARAKKNKRTNNRYKKILNNTLLPKHFELLFVARTSALRPYEIIWQIVNTGLGAQNANGLRGNFEETPSLTKPEYTLYSGIHCIECFIIKDGACVARSGEFVVRIE